MSFKANLEVDGVMYRVLECSYAFNQSIDSTGRPSSGVRGGTITVKIESSKDPKFALWMINPEKIADGKIIFYQRDSEQRMKEIEFKNGYVIAYSEHFSNTGTNPLCEHFTISAKEIKIGEVEHKNNWPT